MKKSRFLVLLFASLTCISVLPSCKSENEKEFEKLKEEQIVFSESDLPRALIKAVEGGQEILVKRLLFAGAPVNATDESGNSALMLACKAQNMPIVNAILDYNPDINLMNQEKTSPLFVAIAENNVPLVNRLLSAGANAEIVNGQGYSPLSDACTIGELEVIRLLCKHGANPNQVLEPGRQPLFIAYQSGNTEAFKELLQQKAELEIKNIDGIVLTEVLVSQCADPYIQLILANPSLLTESVRAAASRGLSRAIALGATSTVQTVLSAGIMPDPSRGSAIKQAVMSTNTAVIAAVLAASKDLDPNDPWVQAAESLAERQKLCDEGYLSTQGWLDPKTQLPEWSNLLQAALINAVRNGNLQLVKRLLKAGASPFANHMDKEPVILMAVRRGSVEMLKLFHEEYGVPFDLQGEEHALCVAARVNACQCISYILDTGVSLDTFTFSPRKRHFSPLREAVDNGNFEAAKLLLSKGANINDDIRGEEPLAFVAIQKGSMDILKLLLERGVNPNSYLYLSGETLLMRAALTGNVAMAETLLDAGADVNEVNSIGSTAAMYAAFGSSLPMIQLLESRGADLRRRNSNGNDVARFCFDNAKKSTHRTDEAVRIYRYLIQVGVASPKLPQGLDVRVSDGVLDSDNADLARDNDKRMRAKLSGHAVAEEAASQGGTESSLPQSNSETSAEGASDGGNNGVNELIALIDALRVETYHDATLRLYQKRLLNILPRIAAGESVNTMLENANGTTALHNACGLGHYEIVKWLVEHGADCTLRTAKGADVITCIGKDPQRRIEKLIKSKLPK